MLFTHLLTKPLCSMNGDRSWATSVPFVVYPFSQSCLYIKKLLMGYALDDTYPNILCFRIRPCRTPLIRPTGCDRFHCHSLLSQSQEKVASVGRPSPVKPKDKLIKIAGQMFVADCTLMRFQHPALKQRNYLVYSWQKFVGLFSAPLDRSDLMPITLCLQPLVTSPLIGANRTARLNGCIHKTM